VVAHSEECSKEQCDQGARTRAYNPKMCQLRGQMLGSKPTYLLHLYPRNHNRVACNECEGYRGALLFCTVVAS
jgi:hypothetical protein